MQSEIKVGDRVQLVAGWKIKNHLKDRRGTVLSLFDESAQVQWDGRLTKQYFNVQFLTKST